MRELKRSATAEKPIDGSMRNGRLIKRRIELFFSSKDELDDDKWKHQRRDFSNVWNNKQKERKETVKKFWCLLSLTYALSEVFQ